MRGAEGTRRDILRGVLAAAVTAALAPLVAASRPSRAEPYVPGGPAGGPPEEAAEFEVEFAAGFDEMYRGRRIRGFKDEAGGVHTAGAVRAAQAGPWRVTVDERPLHLMRRADGGYLTMVDHYQSYPTPLAAARAAVDELGGTLRLREPAAEVERGEEHGHGVHA
ncbi:tyrosinase family oxidase copper chaperone [Streptomyces sp. Qhu-G9]|uniref:tyrosinase family oxidase copper chaperone n=1 Tax=Streptomyces sp. Qhu-G9 TaxID=3452799 RepID=UPI0022ABE01D|nr:tyrosinase family oxidase copper chaperone [Streptomyces aurantiacus]WAU79586.1 tyrosinase family oxidase copper chaperone [Streptomyces aurantiacus]